MSGLAQNEADGLRTMPKHLTRAARADFRMPSPGDAKVFEAQSADGRTHFLFDVNRRGKIKLTRCTYQERYRITDVLARLDIDGPPHSNPNVLNPPLEILIPHNGASMPCPHFHFYVEGYDDRWAIPASEAGINQSGDLVIALREFMGVCGVVDVPTIQYPTF